MVILNMIFIWIEDSGSQAAGSNGGAETPRAFVRQFLERWAADSNGDAETASETTATTVPSTLAEPNSSETSPPDRLAEVHQTLVALQELFEQSSNNQQSQKEMFKMLHEEMTGYKENFVLEEFRKPAIRDLLPVYDSFELLESQLGGILNAQEEVRSEKLTDFQENLKNARFQLLDALEQLGVHPYDKPQEKLDPKLHKAVEVIEVDTDEKDLEIATVHKIGFCLRGKVIRPEEVTVYRYNPPKTEEGEETNG